VKGIYFLALTILTSIPTLAYDTVRFNLSNTWQVYDGENYTAFDGRANAVHLLLAHDAKGYIEIQQQHPFSVFINDRLFISHQLKVKWSVDSLRAIYFNQLRISIFSEQGTSNLSTQLITVVPDQNLKNSQGYLYNAIITASFALMVILVILFRTGSQATLEYFNVTKVFSVRNTDEGVITTRVTSANNVFFYLFCSAVVGVNLFIFSGENSVSETPGFTNSLVEILIFSGAVSLVLVLKIVWVSVSARLFKLSEFAPGQFYNFVRLLLIGFSTSSIVLLINFMLGGDSQFIAPTLINLNIVILIAFMGVTFIKLNSRGGFTVFHLFSYLCLTEMIPFIILLKIYFS
jgi:hypothetical protein